MGGKERSRLSKQTTLIYRLQEQARIQPHKRAFTFLADGDTEIDSLTYQQLNETAKAIAFVLQSHQAQGQRALLLYQPGLDFITAFLGCLYAGVVAVPVYPPRANRSIERLLAIVADAGASFALTTKSIQEQIASKFAEQNATENLQFIATDTFKLDLGIQWHAPEITPDDLAFLQYTSGSTGKPKGVMVSQGNLMANSNAIRHCFGNHREHTLVSWLPPYHDMGLIGSIIQPVYVGSSMYLMAPVTFLQRPYRWLQAISKYRGQTNGGPNFAYDLCVEKITPEQKATLDLSCWELAFSGAEPVRAETLDRFSEYFRECGFRRQAFYPCYGMAESTLMITGSRRDAEPVVGSFELKNLEENQAVNTLDSESSITLVSSGSNTPEQKLVIVEPETSSQCPDSKVGEIWVKSASVAQGYWHRPELSANSFDGVLADTHERGWLRTGDLGFLQDGELFVTGRLKDLIIIRGRNYYPQDIELTVDHAHEAIRAGNVAAFAVEVAGEERLVVTPEIKRTSLRKLDVDSVTKAIRRAVAENHELQIHAIVLLKTGSIPKTSSGKIQRHACQAGYLDGSLNSVGEFELNVEGKHALPSSTAPHKPNQKQNQIQNWLIENLAQRIGISASEIDINEPFANSGLSSLAAVSLSADLEDWLEIKLSPTIVYDYPNIVELAKYLSQTESITAEAEIQSTEPGVNKSSDIAIIGMGCRFPGANSPEEFWQLLRDGQDAISKSDRWKGSGWGGFIDDVDKFDPQFFGITPREAQSIDPQQRILLEVSWSALEDAAVANSDLTGSKTGVFIGISSSDYSQLRHHYGADVDAYLGTGNAHSIAANRLSYLFDLKGPSMAVDTACSSSLVALHLATQSLKAGECNLAIAGGVNLMLSPELTQTFELAGMMAEDGRCKTFDANADGYVRGEGCGVIILKRLADARRDGDRLLAVIKGSAINQDGRSNGLTAPNGLAQQGVMRQALANAQIAPESISYIESHGTGTSLGDPIEVNSLKVVLGQEREESCYLGSLKTNIGHLEAAAGIAGLIKAVLCLQNKAIPPNLHFQQLNPLIDLAETKISIPQRLQPWNSAERYAGVSSFGFGGTNAHVVLGEDQGTTRQGDKETGGQGDSENSQILKRTRHLLTLSAKTESALKDLVLSYQDYLENNRAADLANICYTSNTGRTHFNHRLAVAIDSTEQLKSYIAQFTPEQSARGITSGNTQKNQRIAFLFTGQGSQYVNMGYQLYQTQPIFRQAIKECAAILDDYLEHSLLEVLYAEHSSSSIPYAKRYPLGHPSSLLNQTVYTQPAIFTLEYALAQMWLNWGVKPTALIGHSVGEYAAATIAGVFSLPDALKLVAMRGKLMQNQSQAGDMFAVFANEATVKSIIAPFTKQIAIAAINSHQSIVISGEQTATAEVISKFDSLGIKSKQLKVSHAFHSPLMKPILQEFRQVAESITYHSPQRKLISNVTGKLATKEVTTAEYWVNHVVAPVRFADGMETLKSECNVFLEIGSKPILIGMARPSVSVAGKANVWLPSLRPRKQDWQQILLSLSELYVRGINIAWQNVARGSNLQKVSLPTYPFQRQSYWLTKAANSSSKIEVHLPGKNREQATEFYQIQWQEYSSELGSDVKADGTWLIFAGDSPLGNQIRAELQQQQDCIVISDRHLNPEFLSTILTQQSNITKIIYLAGLELSSSPTIGEINGYQQQHCTNILHLLQSLTANSLAAPMWLATRGTQALANNLDSTAVASSCLWGLASAIAVEHPELWGGIIDLEAKSASNEVNSLLQVVTQFNREDRVAVRKNKFYVPRLDKSAIESKPWKLSPEGSYLVTGGLGSLGLQVARLLADRGAKNLVLLGRSQPSESAQRVIDQLEQQGVTVNIAQIDITNYEAVNNIVQSLSIPSSPLRGIVHAAGVLQDSLLPGQTWDKFSQVIAPKAIGAWNLHRATKDLELDFLVLFSSVASLIGSPGQSNYTVANASLDAIAHYRRSLNLPALSINWGAWADSGMAIEQGFSIKGLNLIESATGLAALEQLITSGATQAGVIDADWHQLSQKFTYLQQSNYFSQLVPQTAAKAAEGHIFEQLLATPAEQLPAALTQYLQTAIAEILQLEAANLSVTDSLLDLGMDSLMVMEAINQLKTDLQLILYPREFYERPQIDNLAEYLAAEFAKAHQQNEPEIKRLVSSAKRISHAKLPPAAFILSSPRSGSTLLRVMLAGHPSLCSPPELHLLPFDTMSERESELGISQLGEGLKRAFMALKGIDAAASQQIVERLIAENATIKEVYQQLQQLAAGRLLIDKSPTYASSSETLAKAEAIFDGAKYIHLVRHPYSVIESFSRMRMDKLVGSGNADPYELAELIWRDSNQNILNLAQEINSKRYRLVYYEDLVAKPQAVLSEICEFLEVPFDPAVLTPYQGDRMTDGVSDKAMSLGDPNFLNHQTIDAQLAETWKEIKLPTALGTYSQQLARQLNYELPQEANADVVDLLMEETLVTIRGLKICLCTWGPEEGPLVLCLHGILEQGAAWSEVAIRLAQKGYRVIAPDLRGHGRSDRVGKGGSYNLIDFLGDIDAIVEILAGKAFILVGHSLGSVLGAIFATIRPQTIKNIVLVETILPTASEEDDPTTSLTNQLNNMASPPEHPVFPDVKTAAERLRKATPAISLSLATLLAERITEPCEGGVRWRWEPLLRTRAGISLNGIGRSRYLKLLKKIKVPITLVYGDKSNLNRVEDLNKQQEAMPNATRVVVSGGHNLPLEAPSALAKIISSAVALTNKLIP